MLNSKIFWVSFSKSSWVKFTCMVSVEREKDYIKLIDFNVDWVQLKFTYCQIFKTFCWVKLKQTLVGVTKIHILSHTYYKG